MDACVHTHYWWPGMQKFVAEQCRRCMACHSHHAGPAVTAPLNPIPVRGPFERIAVDVLQLPKSQGGKQYAVVFLDYSTKWPEVYATSHQDTITIAKPLVEQIIPVHGIPRQLLTDRGGCFVSTLIYELYRLLSIQKLNTTAYHPLE